jgi:hypothetical protein
MKPLGTLLPALVVAILADGGAWAGEILIGPDKAEVRNSDSRNQRARAGAYQRGAEAIPAEEEEGGFLSPRGGAPAEERAYDSRARARAYQQGADPSAVMPGLPPGLMGDVAGPGNSQDRARDQRARARTYSGSGNAQDLDLSNVGPDGIPIVSCRGDVDNSAARIGEDGVSGSIFYVMRNNKPVKVRCR